MSDLLKISEATAIALHVMAFLSSEVGVMVSAKKIARHLDCSEAHLAKVMQRLGKMGLVKSARGPHGGFLLGRPARSITLLEIYEAIEGPLKPARCLFKSPVCDGSQCILGDFLEKIGNEFKTYMTDKKLSDFNRIFAHKKTQKQAGSQSC